MRGIDDGVSLVVRDVDEFAVDAGVDSRRRRGKILTCAPLEAETPAPSPTAAFSVEILSCSCVPPVGPNPAICINARDNGREITATGFDLRADLPRHARTRQRRSHEVPGRRRVLILFPKGDRCLILSSMRTPLMCCPAGGCAAPRAAADSTLRSPSCGHADNNRWQAR